MNTEIAYNLYHQAENPVCMTECGFQSFEKKRVLLPPRISSVYMLHFIVKGEGTLRLEKEVYPLKTGALFLCPPHVKLTYHSSKHNPYTYFWINFSGEEATPLLQQLQLSRENPVVYPQPFEEIREAFESLVFAKDTPDEYLAISTLYRILHLTSQSKQPREYAKKSYCERIKEYVRDNYADPNLRVAHIAEVLHVSPHYMSRLFTAQTNQSIISYLIAYRMEKAKTLLESGFSVSETSEAVGYDDLCNFSKTYKKTFGITPQKVKSL